jgi:hypothetical protein
MDDLGAIGLPAATLHAGGEPKAWEHSLALAGSQL